MHDAYPVGNYWLRPSYPADIQERSTCRHCNELDSLEHILIECETPGQKEMWGLAEEILSMRNIPWKTPTLGTVLTAATPVFKNEKGKRLSGDERLYTSIVGLTAQLIWAVRCERIIEKEDSPFSEPEIRNRWCRAVNNKLAMDIETSRKSFGRKALKDSLVRATWTGTVLNEDRLPELWVRATSEVLVGINVDLENG